MALLNTYVLSNIKKFKIVKQKILLMLVTFVMSTAWASAQNKNTDAHVIGHVIDKETKEHIPYASVSIKGSNIATFTDVSGHYILKNLPLGNHTLLVSILGYKSQEQAVKVEKDKTIEIKFELLPQLLSVDELVVTGSRSESKRRESSTVVSVASSRLFETTASSSPAEALNFQSGVRVESTCGNCASTELRINGLGGQYSQILLDSRPIFSALAGVYSLEQLPASMIERVELIRGGGSALFGSNAIGGVVNIISKEPIHNLLSISNTTGFFGKGKIDNNLSINGAFVTDDYKAGVYVFGMVKNRDDYDRNNDGFSDLPKLSSETIGFRAYYKLSKRSKITAEYHHIREFRRGGDKFEEVAHKANIAEQLRHNINGGGLKYDFFSSNYKHHLSLYTSVQHINRDSYFGAGQDLNAYGSTKDFTLIAGAQYAYSFDKLLFMPSKLTFGTEYSDNNLDDKMLGYSKIIEQNSSYYGTYLQNEWKTDKLSLLIGGRLDKHNKMSNVVFNPRANVRYTPIKELAFRASYSSGYRAPQIYDEDLHVAAVGGKVAIITVDPNLKPEYSNTFSASVDFYKSFRKMQVNILLEGFYTDIKDVFALYKNGLDEQGNQLWERRNGFGSIVKGFNLEAKFGFSTKFVVDLGFTVQQSKYKENFKWSDEPSVKPQKRMFRSPNNYGYLTLNYYPVKPLSIALNANYTGSMLVQHSAGYIEKDREEITPKFFDLGLRAAYDLPIKGQFKVQINAGIKNIFDQYQKDLDVGALKDSKYIYGPTLPRMFYFGLKFSL